MGKVDFREILRLDREGLSKRKIALSLGHSRDTISKTLNRAKRKGITLSDLEGLTNKEVELKLFPERKKRGEHAEPDYEHVHQELAKRGVTLTLLYDEYTKQCETNGELQYSYSQFRNKYTEYAKCKKATLRVVHKPGEALEVDWAGDVLYVCRDENTTCKAYLFVACLPFSQLIYAEAFPNMKSESWLTANVHALEYIGGVPASIVPDNLKTGVTKHTPSETIIAPGYRELATHYGTVILPTRVRAPRDKASVERSVGICETWITAKLRTQQFFSFADLNAQIRLLVDELNIRPFQHKDGSRRSVFENEEHAFLNALPTIPYEVPIWKSMTVPADYLLEIEGCRYSVPYEYIGCVVLVRITRETIDVRYQGTQIASHARREPQKEPVYKLEHMPENHRQAIKYTEEYCRQWAVGVGGKIKAVATQFLNEPGPTSQKTRKCTALMRLADKYSLSRLEQVCAAVVSADHTPSVETIKQLLASGREVFIAEKPAPPKTQTQGFVRGNDYYAKKGIR